jgi:hypothetical protein
MNARGRTSHSAERVRILVEAGADINAQSLSDGATPLHVATPNRTSEIVRTLLSLGSDAQVQDHAGKKAEDTVLGRGSGRGAKRSIKLLVDATAPPPQKKPKPASGTADDGGSAANDQTFYQTSFYQPSFCFGIGQCGLMRKFL